MAFGGSEGGSEDGAKTDNRIAASRSPLTSLVPDPKRDLAVTAQADPDQKIPRDLDWGRVLLPMYQSEALWLNLDGSYPFAEKVATGKINAITGENWRDGIHRDPQDYVAYSMMEVSQSYDMGLAPGGRMKQEIYDDPHGELRH